MDYWLVYFAILILGLGGLIKMLICLRHAKRPYPGWENAILVAMTLFVTLMALEVYFKVFFAQSDSIPTLANDNWNKRYLDGTFNSLGYRDKEWTDKMVAGKIKVMVVGDSFVKGTGVENFEDRFPDRLGQMLGPRYVVFNLGRGGADTGQEIEAITNYPYRPDILLLSYYVNDVEGVADKLSTLHKPPLPKISPWLYPIVQNSYSFNFLYWRLYRLSQLGQPDHRWEWQLSLINHPDGWQLHKQQLLLLYQGTKSARIPFIVVVFPSMSNIERSQVITKQVLTLYQEMGVPTLDVTDLIKDIPVNERVANSVDPHPSELVHQRVAKALYKMFIDLDLESKIAEREFFNK